MSRPWNRGSGQRWGCGSDLRPGRGFQPSHPDQDHAGSTIAAHEGVGTGGARPLVTRTGGLDVASYQGNVDWSTAAGNGAGVAYVKATEGTGYTHPYFAQQYNDFWQYADSGTFPGDQDTFIGAYSRLQALATG